MSSSQPSSSCTSGTIASHEGNQQLAPLRCGDFQQFVAAAEQIAHGADHRAIGAEARLQTQQIQKVELALFQFGPIVRRNHQRLAHQCFCCLAAFNACKAHHEQALARQLTTTFQFNFLRCLATCFEPPSPGLREPFREFTGGVDPQFAFKPLNCHHLAHRQPIVALRHAIRRALCR